MLNSQNSGKYLYGRWGRRKNKATIDKEGFDSDELTWLEISGRDGTSFNQDSTYEIDTTPVDPLTKSKHEKIDIRKLPGHD